MTSTALAQSKPVSAHVAKSAKHSVAIPRHLLHAGGHSLAGSVRMVSGVAAVPVWMIGGVSTGVGTSLKHSGKAAGQTANTMWDSATGDPAKRPALDRNIGLPKLKKPATRRHDPSPAEALKQTRPGQRKELAR